MKPFYTLYVGRASTCPEIDRTIPHLAAGRIGGFSRLRGRGTVWAFARRRDRDNARIWLLKAASERGLSVREII